MLPFGCPSQFGDSVALFASCRIRILLDSFWEAIWGDGRDALILVNKKDAGPVLTLHEFPM